MTGAQDCRTQRSLPFVSPMTSPSQSVLIERTPKKERMKMGRTGPIGYIQDECSCRIQLSPLGLLEELYCDDDPWQLLIATIFLNRTRRIQVDRVLYEFFTRWPSARSIVDVTTTLHAEDGSNMSTQSFVSNIADGVEEEIKDVIAQLGLGSRRANGIVKFSADYLRLVCHKRQEKRQRRDQCEDSEGREEFTFSNQEVKELYQCGDYAADAYQIFVRRQWRTAQPTDIALKAYVEWKLGACWCRPKK